MMIMEHGVIGKDGLHIWDTGSSSLLHTHGV